MVKDLPKLIEQYLTRPTVITQAFKEILDHYIASHPENPENEVIFVSNELLNLIVDDLDETTKGDFYRGVEIRPAANWLPFIGGSEYPFDIHGVVVQATDLNHPMLLKLISSSL